MQLKEAEFLQTQAIESRTGATRVCTTPPFLDYVEAAVWNAGRETDVEQVVKASHGFDTAYLGWEINRKCGSPVGCLQTGFEGYFVGLVSSPEQAYEEILGIGRGIVQNIERQHKHSYQMRNQLEQAIRTGTAPRWAVEEWAAIFGATLARQRARILANPVAQQYRGQVRDRAARLHGLQYQLTEDGQVVQEYQLDPVVGADPCCERPQNDRDAYAYAIMSSIGKWGHPLLRSAMRYAR